MSLKDLFHSVATGTVKRQNSLTPVGLILFGLSLLIVIYGGMFTDRILNFPALLSGWIGRTIGIMLLLPGAAMTTWCVVHFAVARGTPVPFNPPKELIVEGPYIWVRNPMLTGIFACLFGLGLILHSISIVGIWTPLYILFHFIELKKVEEPELELRFGESYLDYKRNVPMFFPKILHRSKNC
jgi:protein-S-isoprenylcysteine O-methyltransferase Ste14